MFGSLPLLFLKDPELLPPTKTGLANCFWKRWIQCLLICQSGIDSSKNTEPWNWVRWYRRQSHFDVLWNVDEELSKERCGEWLSHRSIHWNSNKWTINHFICTFSPKRHKFALFKTWLDSFKKYSETEFDVVACRSWCIPGEEKWTWWEVRLCG